MNEHVHNAQYTLKEKQQTRGTFFCFFQLVVISQRDDDDD